MTDFLLVAWVSALIEVRRLGWVFGMGKRWAPGEKLKLLLPATTARATQDRTCASRKCCGKCGMCLERKRSTSA